MKKQTMIRYIFGSMKLNVGKPVKIVVNLLLCFIDIKYYGDFREKLFSR